MLNGIRQKTVVQSGGVWHSDIDLAVWGIRPEDYLRAGAAAEKGHDFPLDLIDAQSAPPHILVAIHQGIEL